jgi:heparinase II/III-like protein
MGLAALMALVALSANTAPADAHSSTSRLLHASCPHRFPLPLRRYGPHRISSAERGVAQVLGRRRRLEPPIDWHQNPFHSYPWQKKLNELSWLDPLIYADLHRIHRGRAVHRALAVVLDWIHQNPRPNGFRAAWERKRAGDRLTRIAFVARRAACEGRLTRSKAGAIITAVRRHAEFLVNDTPGPGGLTNHALLRDQGLLIGARLFGFLGSADHWRRVALRRFDQGIDLLVDRRTGIHLEHTPGYEQKTISHIEVVLGLLRHPPARYQRLLKRMKVADGWFTMPDDQIVPIADTPFRKPAPRYGRRIGGRLHGISQYLRDGFAIARRAGSYLATVAGFHRIAHKHADELTFDLFENGRRVIVDSGRRDHTQAAGKGDLPGPRTTTAWTESSFAHSTLVVDGRSFPIGGHPYGSALDAEGSGDGWFAVLGHNPLVRAQGVRHQRLLLYRPGHALVVADRLRSKHVHTYSRYLQIAPGIRADRHRHVVRLKAPHGFRGSIWSPVAKPRLYRGSLHPLRGWYVRGGYHSLTPRFTERLRTRGRGEHLIATVGIGGGVVKAHRRGPHAFLVRIPGHRPERVVVVRHGKRLHVAAKPR